MTEWNKIAFVFPGQGSQVVGMGKDLAATYPIARQTFEEADSILGFALSDLCWNGPADDLNDTINTQPALYTSGLAILRVLGAELPGVAPAFVAGHSLGEFTALAAAGALSFADGLRLVRERGRLMKEAGTKSPGAMATPLGLDAEAVRELCARAREQTGGVLVLANDNCPGQTVISGDDETIEAGMQLAQQAGARKVVRLAVSIAAHSPLMESAAAEFRQTLANTPFNPPQTTIYGNVNAAPLENVEAIRDELGRQLTQSVRWTESVLAMRAAGVETFVELGPGEVLCGLVKRIDRDTKRIPLNSAESVAAFITAARPA
jgi:[acyl-carrier-protein] S-malonyltransferase